MDSLKQFVFNALLLEDSFVALEDEGVSVRGGREAQPMSRISGKDFSPRIVHGANQMASVYVAFYCLENAVRELISERLAERRGLNWWNEAVPRRIREQVASPMDKENRYHAQRSADPIGYTMFGNLAQIIISNWDDFSDLFPEQAWVTARFKDMEMSRNIIMHTSKLPQIEIDRIESIMRDWLSQVG